VFYLLHDITQENKIFTVNHRIDLREVWEAVLWRTVGQMFVGIWYVGKLTS